MDEQVRVMLAKRLALYKRIAAKTGTHFRCLDEDWTPDESSVSTIESDDGKFTIRIDGPFDSWWGLDVRSIIRELDEREAKSIHLLIESPGGLLDDGIALYLDLRARARDGVKVITESRGLVASAAVLPYLAGDERITSTGSQVMIHNPWVGFCFAGSANEIEDYAASLVEHLYADEKNLQTIYHQRTSARVMDLKRWLDAEKVFNAEDSVRHGFATSLVDESPEDDTQKEEVNQFVQNLHNHFVQNIRKGVQV